MGILDIAYTIVGSRERNYNQLHYQRYMTWLLLQPHIKEGSLKKAEDIFALPTDDVIIETTRESVEDLMALWNTLDGKEWKSKGVLKG